MLERFGLVSSVLVSFFCSLSTLSPAMAFDIHAALPWIPSRLDAISRHWQSARDTGLLKQGDSVVGGLNKAIVSGNSYRIIVPSGTRALIRRHHDRLTVRNLYERNKRPVVVLYQKTSLKLRVGQEAEIASNLCLVRSVDRRD